MTSTDSVPMKDSIEQTLQHIRTAESVFVPKDVFEKLYLNPERPVAGRLRQTVGNPTPLGLIGFLLAGTPNAIASMGWRGAGGNGGALLTVFIFFGGVLQIIGALGNWMLGNTFSSTVFFTFGGFWLSQGTALQPFYPIGAAYSAAGDNAEGMTTPGFYATTGFFFLCMAVLTYMFAVCAVRVNVILFAGLHFLTVGFGCFTGVYWNLAEGNHEMAARLQKVGGAFVFALCAIVWYLLFSELLESVDFPIALPVGDLSQVVPGMKRRRASSDPDKTK
ncbi:uncharacterized protein PV06_09715 [Exophiala oligosperma]|uniref:GPR1/FUN34/YaaH-class plasma membrane protein n=1 Tax=Exophiala oligosperma TaxID=215243 RepID=A0A0D2D8I1_9EURO|nr:uncharacterized protein PV06_09715 [Exophiala oligosperma]KIW38770.1 hypothetical protein PV06_09715 [Exophiala oligosperma]